MAGLDFKRPGDYVVVQMNDQSDGEPGVAMVKQLVGRTPDETLTYGSASLRATVQKRASADVCSGNRGDIRGARAPRLLLLTRDRFTG